MDYTESNKHSWVEYWAKKYKYPNGHLYENNIREALTEARVLQLFEWKNGTPLSRSKNNSVLKNYVSQIEKIPSINSINEGRSYLSSVNGGAIWGIFWLHCINPEIFPIFDQHTYRAMRFIKESVVQEIPSYNPKKIRVYFEEYLPFFSIFDGCNERLIDKALFAYGKSLKV